MFHSCRALPRLSLALLLAILLYGCAGPAVQPPSAPGDDIAAQATPGKVVAPASMPAAFDVLPEPVREFRGLWVATISNLDWPSARGLSVEQQQAEVRRILDRAVELKFNAILLQVRPSGDALYRSSLVPWSLFLTGTMGKDPGYDPLAFWIAEAHRRGLQLHAWLNPFRVGTPAIKPAEYSDTSAVRAMPALVKSLGKQGYYWLNPGDSRAQEHLFSVTRELLDGYDLDGIVLDDYFYPYPEYYDAGRDFPDDADLASAVGAGLLGDKAAWRRANIDGFVRRFYEQVKAQKPAVLVGISPFGIWRPHHPRGIAGKDSYAELYTDTRRWLNEGWMDYFAPQLYWPIQETAQSFPALLEWWKGENSLGRHLWPALNLNQKSPHMPTHELRGREYATQIFVQRGMLPRSPGFILFRAGNVVEPRAASRDNVFSGPIVLDELRTKALPTGALVPRTPWLPSTPPEVPSVTVALNGNRLLINWNRVPGAFRYVVYTHRKSSVYKDRIWWESEILGPDAGASTWDMVRAGMDAEDAIDLFIVTAVNRAGEESPKRVLPVARASR